MIEKNQVYRSIINPRDPQRDPIRIKVVEDVVGGTSLSTQGKVRIVTVTANGREVRPRLIEASQLHESRFTKDGAVRLNGYVLEP